MNYWSSCLLFSAILGSTTLTVRAATDTYYTAAVFEHARFDNGSAEIIIAKNLEFYARAAKIAKSKGADVIVYPEYGIFPPGERLELKNYLENIPDPRKIRANPCEEKEFYSNRPILYTLSCIAKDNDLVLVGNTGDIQTCDGQKDCPSDGVFHFNANVAFDRDGTLLVRYHKEHLFFELGMDLPRAQQDSTFKTDFGTFATFICFDIIYKRMNDVAKWPKVDAILFPTMWLYSAPQYPSVQWFESWAIGTNATLIAANIQMPGHYAVGSGIFDGKGPLAYTYNPDGISKLLVTRVPKSNQRGTLSSSNTSVTAITSDGAWELQNDGEDVLTECSTTLLGHSKDFYKDYRCLEVSTANYTFVKLTDPKGHVEACNNGMCCSLKYSSDVIQDNFYFGVYNGSHNAFDRYFWCEENCLMIRCEAFGDNPCATFPMRSKTVFHHVEITANFTADYVYPSVVNSGMRLVPQAEWNYELGSSSENKRSVKFHSKLGKNLITAGMKGRCYQRDPPFVR